MERVVINVQDSQVGTINTGQIVGSVENHLTQLAARSPDAVELLRQLAEDVTNSDELGDEAKQGALEAIDFLAEEAAKDEATRRPGPVRSVMRDLSMLLSASAALAKLWETAEPHVHSLFGL